MSQDKYIELLHKELSSDLKQEEVALLMDWVNASPANKQLAEEIRETWNMTKKSTADLEALATDVDMQADFDQLRSRIHAAEKNTTEKTTKVIPVFRRGWIAAAGLALIIGLSATFYFTSDNFQKRNWEMVEAFNAPEVIELTDGSVIHLNANSTLHYPTHFEGENRTVELNGEGFFDIAKDPEHPFIIQTPFESVTVLGTSFNVRAYEKEHSSEIAVSTGQVSVSSAIADIILDPNDKVIVDHSSGAMELKTIEEHNELAWLTGQLEFDDTAIPDVLHDLENHFKVSFDYDYQIWEECFFTASFETVHLDTVLTTLSTVLEMEIAPTGDDAYQITGGGCE